MLGRSRTIQFRVRDYQRIAAGELTLTFRRWRRPQARVGGRYRVGEGAVEVDQVSQIAADAITPEDARAAGFETPAAALEAIERNQRRGADRGAQLYRVSFHFAGSHVDPRKQLQADDELDHDELESLVQRLAKMDGRSQRGAVDNRDARRRFRASPALAPAISPRRRAARLPGSNPMSGS